MSDKTIQNTTVGTVQPGALTAIARKEDFLQHLQDFLDTHKTEKWCVAAIDVEHFRLKRLTNDKTLPTKYKAHIYREL